MSAINPHSLKATERPLLDATNVEGVQGPSGAEQNPEGFMPAASRPGSIFKAIETGTNDNNLPTEKNESAHRLLGFDPRTPQQSPQILKAPDFRPIVPQQTERTIQQSPLDLKYEEAKFEEGRLISHPGLEIVQVYTLANGGRIPSSPRGGTPVDTIVFHTALSNEPRDIFEGKGTQQGKPVTGSTHFLILPEGEVVQYVSLNRASWTATYYNERSVNIEFAGVQNFTPEQLKAAKLLTALVSKKMNIATNKAEGRATSDEAEDFKGTGFVGHNQIQPDSRYYCPGDAFPWKSFVRGVQRYR